MQQNNDYRKYLKSKKWRKIRLRVLKNYGFKCCKCGSKKRLQVYHIKYPRILGTETDDMMICLCKSCHFKKYHKKKRERVKEKYYKEPKNIVTFVGPQVYDKRKDATVSKLPQ